MTDGLPIVGAAGGAQQKAPAQAIQGQDPAAAAAALKKKKKIALRKKQLALEAEELEMEDE